MPTLQLLCHSLQVARKFRTIGYSQEDKAFSRPCSLKTAIWETQLRRYRSLTNQSWNQRRPLPNKETGSNSPRGSSTPYYRPHGGLDARKTGCENIWLTGWLTRPALSRMNSQSQMGLREISRHGLSSLSISNPTLTKAFILFSNTKFCSCRLSPIVQPFTSS